jgi:putative molybdopterin biosynthesis protein
VAAAVAAGAGQVALGLEAAAAQFGLGFVPLVSEDYFLVCLAQTLDLPAVQALRQVLQQPAWAHTLAALPGYRPSQAGQVLSLTRALPWWRFRSAKGDPAAGSEAQQPHRQQRVTR